MNGIMNLDGMSNKHEETNCCAFEKINSYVKNTLGTNHAGNAAKKIACGMLCYSETKVTLCCVWVFFPEEFNS